MPKSEDKGYQGRVVWVPLGDRGLEPNANPARIPTSALITAESIVYTQDSMRKMGGTQKISGYSGSISSVALFDWWASSGTQKWVRVGTDGNAYLQSSPAVASAVAQNGASSSLGASALTTCFPVAAGEEATSLTDAIQYRKLFLFTGRAPLRYYDGGSPVTTTIASPAEDWSGGDQPIGGALHNGCMWAWGTPTRPHGLYRSRSKNHAYFASETITAVSTQFFTVTPGAGQRIYAGKSHKGLLFLFKYPVGVAWLDDSDINPGGWRLSQLTDSVGCAKSPYSAILLDDGIVFMTPNAEVYLLTATTQGGVELVNLSAQMNLTQWLKDNVNTVKLHLMSSCWNGAKKQAIFAVNQRGSANDQNGLLLTFDFNNLEQANGVPRFAYSTRAAAQALCTRKNSTTFIEVPVYADYSTSGLEYQMDEDYRSADSSSTTPSTYAAAFQTAHSNLVEYTSDGYDASMNKLWDFIDIEYIPIDSMGPLLVTIYIDGTQTDQFTVTLTPTGNVLGGAAATDFTLATDGQSASAAPLAVLATRTPNSVSMVRRRLTGEGRRISTKMEHTTSANTYGDDFNITGVYFSFRDGGQDVGRNTQTQ